MGFLLASLLVVGCATGSSGAVPGRDRELISQEEIEGITATTAYEIVERLRPSWLRTRGPSSIRSAGASLYPIVYVDEVHSGSLETLYRISGHIVREIRFINGRDATTKWGLDHGAGVIMVLTGR
jgi:hypothetical protein